MFTQQPVILPTKKKKNKKGYPGFTREDKIAALLLYKKNGYQLVKTAKEVGISIRSLSIWRDQLGIEVFREDEAQTQSFSREELTKQVQQAKEEIGAGVSKIFEMASATELELIERIREVAKTSINLDHLSRCLKVINEIISGKPDEEVKTPGASGPANSYYQLVMTQIIKVKEDLEWTANQEQAQLSQSKSLPPSPSPE